MTKLKIAVYSGVVPSTTFIENLIYALADQGVKVLLFGSKQRNVAYRSSLIKDLSIPEKGLARYLTALRNKGRLFFHSSTDYKKLSIYINKTSKSTKGRLMLWAKWAPVLLNKPDVFHVQWAKSLKSAYFLEEIFQIPIVLSLRGAHINYSPLSNSNLADSYRALFGKISAFHAVSEAIANEAAKYGARMDKIQVVHSALDFTNITPKSSYEIKNEFNILSVGRFHWKKGYHFALRAMKILKDQGCNFKYHLVAGKPSDEVLYIMKELNLTDNVIFYNGMPQNELFQVIRKSDCLLLPSVEEGIANVVLEARAMAVPVVSSDCGGMTEVLEDGVNSFVFAARDVQSMADKLLQLYNLDVKDRAVIASNGTDYIKEHFSKEKLAKGMMSIYTKVI